MELVKGNPYFCSVEEKIRQYPYLDKDVTCEVLIVGGGIMGAVLNHFVSKEFETVLVEKSRLSYGCSACSTALLEYNLDDDVKTLSSVFTEKQIADVFQMGQEGLTKIENFIKRHGNHCHYAKKDIIIYSNRLMDIPIVENDYDFLIRHGFQAQLFTEKTSPFNFEIKRAILLSNSGAEANTYLLAKSLIESSKNQKNIFENTSIERYVKKDGKYMVFTSFGNKIICDKLIFATGFAFDLFSKLPLCKSFLTYCIVTNPIEKFSWHNDALIQDVLDPYHYLRRLTDGRILLGGEDKPFVFGKSIDKKSCEKKYEKLFNTLKSIFPEIADKLKIEYSFAGAFGSTENNLGCIGEVKKDLFLFLSMGANGIVNAFYAVENLIKQLKGEKPNAVMRFFSPKRKGFTLENVKNK